MTDMNQAPSAASQSSAAPDNEQGESEKNEVTVCIQLNTQTGEIKVGVEPEGQDEQTEESTEDQWMQPAQSIDEALQMAKQMLESGKSNPADEAAFEQGHASVNGAGLGGGLAR